jgi:hypothetical protein
MKQLRHVYTIEVNREQKGVYSQFKKGFEDLKKQGFELKSYTYQMYRFSKANSVTLYCVKKGSSFFTLRFVKWPVNVLN